MNWQRSRQTAERNTESSYAGLTITERKRQPLLLSFVDFFFSVVQGYMLYTIPPLLGLLQYSSLVFVFIHLCVQFCSYLCIILFCLLHVLILCIVYLYILCIRRSSLWLLYFNKRVCVISIKPSMRFLLRCGRQW